jgi:hypothetical protein
MQITSATTAFGFALLTSTALFGAVASADEVAVYGSQAVCIGSKGDCGNSCKPPDFPLGNGQLCQCVGRTGDCTVKSDCGSAANNCYVYQGVACAGSGQSTCADGFTCEYGQCVHTLAEGEAYGGLVMSVDTDAGTLSGADAGGVMGDAAVTGDASAEPSTQDPSSTDASAESDPGSAGSDAGSPAGGSASDSAATDSSTSSGSCSAAGRGQHGSAWMIAFALSSLVLRRRRARAS